MNTALRALMTSLTKPVVRVLALAGVAVVLAGPAMAGPIGFQANGGWYSESEKFFLGAGARLGVATVAVIPNVEWLFVDNGSTYTVNVDGTLNVLPMGVASGYVGAGVGWMIVDLEGFDSNSDMAVNLLAGAAFNLTSLKPFAQFKWVVLDADDPMVFSLGLRF